MFLGGLCMLVCRKGGLWGHVVGVFAEGLCFVWHVCYMFSVRCISCVFCGMHVGCGITKRHFKIFNDTSKLKSSYFVKRFSQQKLLQASSFLTQNALQNSSNLHGTPQSRPDVCFSLHHLEEVVVDGVHHPAAVVVGDAWVNSWEDCGRVGRLRVVGWSDG